MSVDLKRNNEKSVRKAKERLEEEILDEKRAKTKGREGSVQGRDFFKGKAKGRNIEGERNSGRKCPL